MIFKDLHNIDAYTCILGLQFPESATEFQKASLTLAHLMACCSDYILIGFQLPDEIVQLISNLTVIIEDNKDEQMKKPMRLRKTRKYPCILRDMRRLSQCTHMRTF